MNVKEIKQWIADGAANAIETAWMAGVEEQAPPDQTREVLECLVKAGQLEMAHTLGWLLLSETAEQHGHDQALAVARQVLTAVPGNDEIRTMLGELYGQVYAQDENFANLLDASGLLDNQSLRRAIRTLDICLSVTPGCFLANRYDNKVVRAERFDATMGWFEVTAAGGHEEQIEPRPLADEFECVEPNDFRVLCQFRKDQMGDMLTKDPAGVLAGICMSNGGAIDAQELNDLLVPKYIDSDKWNGWWNRARTAGKRSGNLTIEGRNPTVVTYHPGGRSPEDELADAVGNARTPLDYLAILKQYVALTRSRKLPRQESFVQPIMRMLAHQAMSFRTRRPNEALAASLVVDAMMAGGMAAPPVACPTAIEATAALADPGAVIAALPEPSLWPAAIEALARREDSAEWFERLMTAMPAGQLDEIAARVRAAGRGEAIERIVEQAVANAAKDLQVCLWLWKGPAEPVPNGPTELTLLSRLLGVMEQIGHDMRVDHNERREAYRQIRSALVAERCKAFRAAVSQMDQGVAGTIKRRIEQSPGLSIGSSEKLISILREEFYGLFLKARIEPWMDETVIYSSAAAATKREAALKHLVEIEVPENSKRVGAAAALGDLSENSEWESAVEEQRRLQARVARIRDELAIVRILHPQEVLTDAIGIGSKVTLEPVAGGPELAVSFLGPWDGNVAERIFNYKAPIAQEMMGQTVGQTVEIRLDEIAGQYVIKAIGSALARE